MNAVGYFVEGARRDGEKRSVGAQNRGFLDFCGRQGYEIAATFLDTEGTSDRQAGFRQMLEFLQRSDRGFVMHIDAFFEGQPGDRAIHNTCIKEKITKGIGES